MARPPRVDYPGAWHHVMNRGARREALFADDDHVGAFRSALANVVSRFSIELHAYVLMPNHYHLLFRSVRGNLPRVMQSLGGQFTQEVNRMRRWDGPLFRGRFRSQLIEDESYLLAVAAYIHLNPVRAGLIRRVDQHYPSSNRAYLGREVPPEWLLTQQIAELAGGHEAFARLVVDLRSGTKQWPEGMDMRTGRFADPRELHAVARPNIEDKPRSPSRKAQEVLRRVREITGASGRELQRRKMGRGGNPVRRFAVWALSSDTNLTQRQIGQHLGMREGHVTMALQRARGEIESRTRLPDSDLQRWAELWFEEMGG